jgi:hypothetical protein
MTAAEAPRGERLGAESRETTRRETTRRRDDETRRDEYNVDVRLRAHPHRIATTEWWDPSIHSFLVTPKEKK